MCIQNAINSIVQNRRDNNGFLDDQIKIKNIRTYCETLKDWYSDPNWKFYLDKLPNSVALKTTITSVELMCEKIIKQISLLISDDQNKPGNLDMVINRIGRGEFNICFMGAWRQGKSFILQHLLNLDQYVMPVHDSNACTGTVVSIKNSGNDGIYEATVHYFTVEKITEIINRYFVELGMDERLTVENHSKNTFRSQCIEISRTMHEPQSTQGNSIKKEYFNTLRTYISHVDSYYDQLGDRPELLNLKDNDGKQNVENLKKLRKKISFYDIDNQEVYEVLSVENVEISKHFTIGKEEVGNIRVTDTAGIGERRIGIDEELKRVLLRDTDIAVGVAQSIETKTTVGDDVCHFHDTISSAIGSMTPSKWFYYIINQCHDTYEHASSYKNSIRTQLDGIGFIIPERNIQVVQPSNSEETYNFILNKILIPIEQNINDVDNVLFDLTKKDIKEIIENFQELKRMVTQISCPDFNADKTKRIKIVDEVFSNIRIGLQNLTNEFNSDNYKDDNLQKLEEEIEDVFNSPERYELTKLFFGNLDQEASSENFEKDLIAIISKKRQPILDKLKQSIIGQMNYLGNELQIFVRYRQLMIEAFYEKINNINDSLVKKSLAIVKDKIKNVFVEQGKLQPCIICLGFDDFFDAIINRANLEGLKDLENYFRENLKNKEILYMSSWLDIIKREILINSKFSIKLNYENDANMIAEQFDVLLDNLEKCIKNKLKDFFQQESFVSVINNYYSNMVGEIEGQLLVSQDKDNHVNRLSEDFITIYLKIYSQIFKDNNLFKQNQGYQKWVSTKNTLETL